MSTFEVDYLEIRATCDGCDWQQNVDGDVDATVLVGLAKAHVATHPGHVTRVETVYGVRYSEEPEEVEAA